jgi:hypothetical protein
MEQDVTFFEVPTKNCYERLVENLENLSHGEF